MIRNGLPAGGTIRQAVTFAIAPVFAAGASMSAGKLDLPRGAVGAPSLTFGGDTTSGLYSVAANSMTYAVSGVNHWTLSASGAFLVSGAMTIPSGTLASPSFRFAGSDGGTGLSAQTADQIQVGRAGVSQYTINSAGINAAVPLITNSSVLIGGALRLLSAAAKTADYTALPTDSSVLMNVAAGGNLTMPASPLSYQRYEVWNASANPLTLVRAGGQTFNGLAANPTVAAGSGVVIQSVTGGTDWRVIEAPAA
jgi:hypothetical protein